MDETKESSKADTTEISRDSCDGKWREKLFSRNERLKYLETAERYWYGKEWYGSEKRKKPA